MTKVEARYELTRPLEDKMLEVLSRTHGYYGIQAIKLHPGLDGLTVTYDASRLKLTDVDRTLHEAGFPVRRLA